MAVAAPPAPGKTISIVYPSVSSGGLGKLIGQLMSAAPLGPNIKLGALLFGLPLIPLGLLLYATSKIFGSRYVLTNRTVRKTTTLGGQTLQEVPLEQITGIELEEKSGQAFFRAADLHLLGKGGDKIATLDAVPRADIFADQIIKTRDAHVQVEEALANINARHA